MVNLRLSVLLSLCVLYSPALAQGDKSHFTLLNPTPPDQMRDFTTDRPDKTESPYTVDAGHYQLEMDFASYTYDRRNPQHESRRVQSLSILPTNFKLGLLNNLDIQLVSENFLWQRDEDLSTHRADETSGAGDTTLRLKLNLWGNDAGKSAFGLLPFITFPTASANLGVQDTEFGLILPLALELPHDFSLGVMTEFDFVRDENDNLNFLWTNSITLGHDLAKNLGAYIELFTSIDPDRTSAAEITFDVGLTYALSKDIQLDTGLNIALTREPDDWNPFIGLSIRY
jgi:outer membrane putative beta-barrel porin/alpha-amylase